MHPPSSPAAPDTLTITLVAGPEGPRALAEPWRAVADAMPAALRRPHHEPGWHAACADHLAADPGALRYALVTLDGRPAAVLPLELHDGGAAYPTNLVLFRHPHTAHADIIAAGWALRRLTIPALLRALQRQTDLRWDVFRAPAHLSASAIGRLAALTDVADAGRPHLPRATTPAGYSNRLPLLPYEEHLARFSRNFRGNLRKARRKLERLAGARLVTAREPDAVARALDDFFAVEASGWKGAAGTGTAIALDPHLEAFYREVAADFAARGACEISLLYDGDRPMAGQFALLAGTGYHLYKIGYDPAYARLAPGNMLLERLLQRLAGHPTLDRVDLVSDQRWHAAWKPDRMPVQEVNCFAATLKGLLTWGHQRTRRTLAPAWRGLRRHLPALSAA